MAKLLVLMSSARKKGNTDQLADAFMQGAMENGHEVEKIMVHYQNIKPCLGCEACVHLGHCVQKDDMTEIYRKMNEADVIVYASPVYFYTWNAPMKLLIDRTFAIERSIQNKAFYLLATGLAPEESYFRIIKESFENYIKCLRAGGNHIVDFVFACHTGAKNDILENKALNEAYEMGKKI